MSSFGDALVSLKHGKRVARTGWNGKGMWLLLVEGWTFMPPTKGNRYLDDHVSSLLPWIGMKTADDKFVPWLASQTDILGDDWEEV